MTYDGNDADAVASSTQGGGGGSVNAIWGVGHSMQVIWGGGVVRR